MFRAVLAAGALVALALPAGAVTIGFVEDFSVNASGWTNNANAALVWNATGGPDGGSYVSTTLGAINNPGTIQFRGNDANGASGGSFAGNWIGAGASVLSVQVIHDAPVPLSFFFRITTGANAPAYAGVVPVPVAPGTWTTLTLVIDPSNPLLIPEGPVPFATVFGNVTNVQVGVSAPIGFENTPFTYGLDQVTVIPEPATAGILAGGLALLAWTRRRPRC